MIPHIHTLFEFISTPYENQHQTLNMKKIDGAKSGFESIQLRYCNLHYTTSNIIAIASGVLKIFALEITMKFQ